MRDPKETAVSVRARFGHARLARPRDVPAEALIVGAALSVQIGASLAVGLLATFAPITVVALRLFFSAAILLLIRPPRIRTTPTHAWRSAVLLGLVFVGMNSAFYLAISRIPLGVAVTIEFLGPLAAAVLGSRRPRDLAWVALAGAGVWVLAGGRLEASDALGVVAAFAAGAGWFLFIAIGTRVARDWPDGRGLTAALVVGSVVALPVAASLGDLGSILSRPGDLGAAVLVALFSSALPWSFELAAMSRLGPMAYGVLTSLEPAIATLVGFALLAQKLDPVEIVAIGLVVAASVGASLAARSLPAIPGELGT
jgi:inner membrane transporter RhtA